MIVVIDPGHGGKDPGAVNIRLRLKEADINLAVATKLKKELLSIGAAVYLTRNSDVFVDLAERCRESNALKADLFISLHCNAAENPDAQGFEIFTSLGVTKADSFGAVLVDCWHRAFPDQVLRCGALKEANFAVLRGTEAPAVLLEMAFISNTKEAALLASEAWQARAAEAVAAAALKWRRDNEA